MNSISRSNKRRVLLLLGSIGCFEIMAVVILFTYPSPTHRVLPVSTNTTYMQLTSTAFAGGSPNPSMYSCDGRGTNPPLAISGVPEGAKSLVLIVDDPDVPTALKTDGVYDHWVLYNIPTTTTSIPANGYAGSIGRNSSGSTTYVAPCPPAQYEPSQHRYVFSLYAADYVLEFRTPPTKAEVLKALQGHTIERVELVGTYKRKGR